MAKKNIIPQLFDVRPVDASGSLDVSRMEKIRSEAQRARVLYQENQPKEIVRSKKAIRAMQKNSSDIVGKNINNSSVSIEKEINDGPVRFFLDSNSNEARLLAKNLPVAVRKKERKVFDDIKNYQSFQLGVPYQPEELPVVQEQKNLDYAWRPKNEYQEEKRKEKIKKPKKAKVSRDFNFFEKLIPQFSFSGAKAFALVAIFVLGGFGVFKGLKIKDLAEMNGKKALINLVEAKEQIGQKNYAKSALRFDEAYENFDEISQEIGGMSDVILEVGRFVPYVSKASSGKYLVQAGKDISKIGSLSSEMMKTLDSLKNPFDAKNTQENVSLLKIYQDSEKRLQEISVLLEDLDENLSKVNAEDIPKNYRAQFASLREKLPEINSFVEGFTKDGRVFTDVLGGNGPRKYLFLFQNNHEIRATGGFIGTYGILDMFNGNIRQFYVDGIFNPDGQLTVDVVPPFPIQKISGSWSLHDSNWFPDFPKSAEKAMWFYEKTGGPTVDGVITMTPEVMIKLLKITGPIEMEEYGVTITADNFMDEVQYEVEVDYDKEENAPKKILADLAPKILDKIFNAKNFSDMAKTMAVLDESLKEKQILMYSTNFDIQKIISERGWSGEVLPSQKDYLSVINSNINGFKTDGVVEEKIEHLAEVQEDGSIVDTVTITRKHNGGNSDYEWFNKVNANYLRVYVPKGSTLISAEGQIREFDPPPLDYDKLGFKRDPQVMMEEGSIKIDDETGTRVYEDSGKTVFGNWTYVSPQETTVIKYKYLLPFKIDLNSDKKVADNYSLVAQKQSGSKGSAFDFKLVLPENYKVIWKYPNDLLSAENKLEFRSDLTKDKFIGVTLEKK